ncbi:MAG TPA: secretin N-terminal domain-containing protein, partial [Verrucomicrobiae bacterium]|nr:secretin N-terminal domain-containing protein [Verrucomicrobiae bacterium]
MKKILPLLILVSLASCAHRPPKQFGAWTPEHEAAVAAPVPPAKTPAVEPPAALAQTADKRTTNALSTLVPMPPATNLPPTVGVVSTNRVPPQVPGPTNTPAVPTTPDPGETAADIIPAGTINFPATDINQVLQIYSELVGRTILRPANLPTPLITLKTQTPLSKKEAIQAFDAVLALNGVTMINVGDKFVKAVPTPQANQEAAAFSHKDASQLPEMGQYVTHVVQLKYVKPSELMPVLQQFAKVPNSILPIDASQILVLRDYTENVKRMLEMIKEIDVSIPSEYLSEVIPIKYAKASDISDALNSLSSGGGTTSVGRSSTGPGRSAFSSGLGRSGPGGTGGYGTPGSTQYGGQAGVGGGMPGQPAAAAPVSFTDRLKNIIKSASGPGELQIIGQTKIIADERTNSLLIFATRTDMEMIKNIVSKLDVVLAQVLIETIIMDVQMNNGWNFGVSGVQTAQSAADIHKHGAGGVNNGQPVFDLVNFLAGAATNSIFPGNMGGGFSYWGQIGKSFDLALQAASSDERINVVQKPRILTSHATPGSI